MQGSPSPCSVHLTATEILRILGIILLVAAIFPPIPVTKKYELPEKEESHRKTIISDFGAYPLYISN